MAEALDRLDDAGISTTSITSPGDPPLESRLPGQPISHGQIIEIAQRLKGVSQAAKAGGSTDSQVYSLDTLLRGSQVWNSPKPKKIQHSNEYRKLMARLRQEEELRAYDRMIGPTCPNEESFAQRFPNSKHRNLFPTSPADIGDEDEVSYADLNRQLGLIINVLLSVIACSAALWIAARHWSLPSRLALSMGGSGTIGIAEVVVYAGYLRRVKEAKQKGKKEKEIKEITDTWVIEGTKSEKEKDEGSVFLDARSEQTDGKVRRRYVSTST